jgi:hydrogenase maturation protease
VSDTRRVLVAGIGNVFLGDDGFGVEVVRRIHPTELPDTVDVADFGIRAVPLGEEPATIAVLDASDHAGASEAGPVDAHSMSPDVVLRALQGLGGHIARVLVVGCQPASIEESMGLSEPVHSAVDDAVRIVTDLALREAAAPAPACPSTTGRRSP